MNSGSANSIVYGSRHSGYFYSITYDWHRIGLGNYVAIGFVDWFIAKIYFMLYIIAIILIIGWLLGFFVFSAGGIIHVLLVLAIIAILLRLIQGRNSV